MGYVGKENRIWESGKQLRGACWAYEFAELNYFDAESLSTYWFVP